MHLKFQNWKKKKNYQNKKKLYKYIHLFLQYIERKHGIQTHNISGEERCTRYNIMW